MSAVVMTEAELEAFVDRRIAAAMAHVRLGDHWRLMFLPEVGS